MGQLFGRIGLPIFVGFALLATYLVIHLGAFKPVSLSVVELQPLHLLYKVHKGPYQKIVGVIKDVETWAAEHHLSCSRTFGEYLDDPRQMDEDRLTSHGGCILDAPASDLPEGFVARSLPAGSYVRATFEGSPAIGPMKVYPKLEAYLSEHRIAHGPAVIEVYTVKSDDEMSTEYLVQALGSEKPVVER